MKKFLTTILVIMFLPTAAQAMTLREAVQTALEKNPSLQRTEKAIEVAEESLKIAKGNKKFSVTASGSANISKYEGTDDSESLSTRLRGTIPIYSGNKLESQIKSAELEIDVAKFQFNQAREDLIFNVATAYVNALETLAESKVYLETEENLSEHEKNISAMYDAGAKAKIDLLRAQVETSNAEQNTAKSRAAYEVNLTTLATLMSLQKISGLTVEEFQTFLELDDIENFLSKAEENRNDLKADELKIDQGEVNIEIARSGKRPTLSAEIGAGLSSASDDWHVSPDASAGLNLSWNIFDSGVTKAEIKSAEIELERLQLLMKNDIDSVHEEVITAYKNLKIALLRIRTTQRAVELAEEERYIATEKYRAGEGILLDVLDSEVALTEAKKNHVSAYHDIMRYRLNLAHAIGDTLSVIQ